MYHLKEGVPPHPPPGTWEQRGLVARLDLLQMWAISFYPSKVVNHKLVRKCSVPSRRQCGTMKSAPGWDSGALISGLSSGSVVLSVCEKGWLGQIRSDCA